MHVDCEHIYMYVNMHKQTYVSYEFIFPNESFAMPNHNIHVSTTLS